MRGPNDLVHWNQDLLLPPSIPESGVLISKSLCFPAFPRLGAAAGSQVRFEDGTSAGYGLVLSLDLRGQAGER